MWRSHFCELLEIQYKCRMYLAHTLCNPMVCSLPGFSTHGIFQERILEWVAISFSKRSSWPRDWAHVSRSRLLHWQADSLPLCFQVNFRITYSSIMKKKKKHWYYDENYTESVYCLILFILNTILRTAKNY